MNLIEAFIWVAKLAEARGYSVSINPANRQFTLISCPTHFESLEIRGPLIIWSGTIEECFSHGFGYPVSEDYVDDGPLFRSRATFQVPTGPAQ